MENENILPKPQTDLPLPEKELPANVESTNSPVINGDIKGNNLKYLLILFLALLVLGGIALGAYAMGKSTNQPTPTPTPEVKITETPTPTEEASPSADITGMQTFTQKKIKDSSILGYTIKYPADWNKQEVKTTKNLEPSSLNLTKKGYSITIDSDIYEGGKCRNADNTSTNVQTNFGLLRRSEDKASTEKTYIFCQEYEPDGSFQSPTSIGIIRYYAPVNPDTKMLTEMDTILKSIQTQ